MLVSIRVAAIYCGYSSTFRPVIFFRTSKKGAVRMQMGHVEFSCHSFFFFHAPSRSVFSLRASEPTVGLPAAFGCIRCHSFYLSVTLLPIKMWSIFIAIRSASHFIRISLRIHWRRVQLMRISFSFHCGYIGVGPKVTGDIRTHLTDGIRTHLLEHLPVTLEVVDTRIKVTCFTWGSAKYWA